MTDKLIFSKKHGQQNLEWPKRGFLKIVHKSILVQKGSIKNDDSIHRRGSAFL